MNYKKIIAATAVTSAAFVAPVVVGAEDIELGTSKDDIIIANTFEIGEKIIAPDTYTNDSKTEKVTKYQWVIEYNSDPDTTTTSTGKTLTVPMNPNITSIALTITTASGKYTQILTPSSTYEGSFEFNPVSSNGEPVELDVENDIVNQRIEANLSGNNVIKKYDWYLVDGVTTRLLGDEQDNVLDIPVAASGKKLLVVATVATDSIDEKYFGILDVKSLELDNYSDDYRPDLKLNGNAISTDVKSIAPGDMLSVENLTIQAHEGEVEILQSQAIVTYQWYYSDSTPSKLSAIPGATGPMYLVPNDAFGRSLDNISVGITVEVPNSGVESKTQYLRVMELTNQAAKDLETTINENLANAEKYDVAKFPNIQTFLEQMNLFKGTYDALSIGSKALVPSYPKVSQALQDIKTVEALIKELEAFDKALQDFNTPSEDDEGIQSDVTHAKLVKQFEKIEKKYLKYDSLKRSILEMDTPFKENYIELMSQHLKNIKGHADETNDGDAITANKVVELNKRIKALYANDENSAYDIEAFVDTDDNGVDLNPRTEMQKEILKIEAEIKKLDRKQQVAVHSSMLKTAKSDIKKAQTMADKMKDIEKNVGEKQIKAILRARESFKKLTFLQQSLITEDERAMFGEDAYSEETIVEDLSDAIDGLVNDTSYVFGDYDSELLDEDATLSSAVEVLLANYKALNSTAKKQVTNYAMLTQAKKDLTAATKVMKSITKAYEFHEAVPEEEYEKKLKSIQSKYRSAYNAYVKLTPLQRSIVEQIGEFPLDDLAEDLESLTGEAFTPSDDDVPYDTTSIENVVIELTALEAAVTAGNQSPSSLETKIKEIEAAYKALQGSEKKGVYNYSILSRAKSLVKKAISVETSLVNALNVGSISRMNSALKSYAKLTSGQKQMISPAYTDVMDALENEDEVELVDALAELLESETVSLTVSLEDLKEIEELLAKVDKREHKKIPGYSKYQEALKIQKAVDAFLKKYYKLDPEPTYSKKQSILKDLKKLTQQQLDYFNESYDDISERLKEWDTGLNTTANSLNDEIGTLITISSAGYSYDDRITEVDPDIEDQNILTNLEAVIAEIKSKYKVLDGKERKLVTHYTFLSKIERDIKAVRKVIDSKAKSNENTFQQNYNRLTNQQQSLFNLVTTP